MMYNQKLSLLFYKNVITRSDKMYLTLKPYPMTLVLWFNCFILSTPLLCSLVACFEEILT